MLIHVVWLIVALWLSIGRLFLLRSIDRASQSPAK